MKEKEVKIILIAAIVWALTPVARADSVQDLIRQGNRLYAGGNYADAIKDYDRALLDRPHIPEPKFNKANCCFQLGDLTRAIDLYNEVAADSKDMKLVEKAKYNLGNCYFQQGSKQKDSNLQKALEDLKTSIVCWRSALEINPQNQNAARNIEVARLTIKDIIDQINKQKEQQQLQKQLEELASRQKTLAQKTGQIKNDADAGKISPQQAEDSYEQQAREQSQIKDKTEQTMQQIQQQGAGDSPPPQMQKAASELQQAMNAQSDAEMQLKTPNGGAAREAEDKAAEHLDNALRELSQNNQQNQEQRQGKEQNQQPQVSDQSGQQQQQAEEKPSAAPDTTAQEILDKEQQEKEQRQILQLGGYQKVEKDW